MSQGLLTRIVARSVRSRVISVSDQETEGVLDGGSETSETQSPINSSILMADEICRFLPSITASFFLNIDKNLHPLGFRYPHFTLIEKKVRVKISSR